jgi:hypothetical protein
MKKAIFTLVFLLIANYVVGQVQIVPKLGYVFQHREGFGAPRLSLAANNLIKERVGFYYSLEYRGGIQFQEDQTSFYFRDLLGGTVRINESFSVYGGVGMFRKGLLFGDRVDGRLRKEVGINYQLIKYKINIDIGYSVWVGPTANFGYIIPLDK